MIGWCEACGKGPVPCAHIQSSLGDTMQCYMCTEGEFDPYGDMDDGESVSSEPLRKSSRPKKEPSARSSVHSGSSEANNAGLARRSARRRLISAR